MDTRSIFGGLLLVAVLSSGCGQGEGEPCQEPDDCGSGLECCKTGGTLSTRGTCQESCTETDPTVGVDAGAIEPAPDLDAGATEPAPDLDTDEGI